MKKVTRNFATAPTENPGPALPRYLRFAFLFAFCFFICVLLFYLRFTFLFVFSFLICVFFFLFVFFF